MIFPDFFTTRLNEITMSRPIVFMAMSGGVDSAVAAHLLQIKNMFDILPLYMQNWDPHLTEPTGVKEPSLLNLSGRQRIDCAAKQEREFEDVQRICRVLGLTREHELPLRINLVPQYWGRVFEPLIKELQSGYIGNPDIECNREIKFDALSRYLIQKQGNDDFYIATGHYARLIKRSSSSKFELRRAHCLKKDQSYFLAGLSASKHRLDRILFPLGDWTDCKERVKEKARHLGLDWIARKKESMGICFVGKRPPVEGRKYGSGGGGGNVMLSNSSSSSFRTFMSEFLDDSESKLFDIDRGKFIRDASVGIFCPGQRANIPGCPKAYYFLGRIRNKNGEAVAVVTTDSKHSLFYSSTLVCSNWQWINEPPQSPNELSLKVCLRSTDKAGTLIESLHFHGTCVRLRTRVPVYAATLGQYAVVYRDSECLGSGKITSSESLELLQSQLYHNVEQINLKV